MHLFPFVIPGARAGRQESIIPGLEDLSRSGTAAATSCRAPAALLLIHTRCGPIRDLIDDFFRCCPVQQPTIMCLLAISLVRRILLLRLLNVQAGQEFESAPKK